MTEDSSRFALYINGLDNAYIREFGCDCPRCERFDRGANTSVSLVLEDASGLALHHVLFDAGSGVGESLRVHPPLRAQARLDGIVLTHWHTDHTSDLTRIGSTYARSRRRRGDEVTPTPLWCRTGSAGWLDRQYPHLKNAMLEVKTFGADEPMGSLLEPLLLGLPGATVTPVSLSHFTADLNPERESESLPCCAGYILELPRTKIAFLWDLDATNLWLEKPGSAQEATLERLHGADHVFFDSNTWACEADRNGRPASHASFGLVQRFARSLEPKHTWLTHLSGHEDERGAGFGWTDDQWRDHALHVWQSEGLPGQVSVPSIGQRIELG